MKPEPQDLTRHQGLKHGRQALRASAHLIQLGFVLLGLYLFLDQAQALLSDAQFTWGERRVMGIVALVAVAGCGTAGWALSQLVLVFADLLDAFAECTLAASRSAQLIETQVVPTLERIASSLENESRKTSSSKAARP